MLVAILHDAMHFQFQMLYKVSMKKQMAHLFSQYEVFEMNNLSCYYRDSYVLQYLPILYPFSYHIPVEQDMVLGSNQKLHRLLLLLLLFYLDKFLLIILYINIYLPTLA
ncbi:MAG: hypothetical protein BHV90_06505 [Clostridiales bacterium 42_27]|nr:MAG: hypothetical protein BHV90_06505 [Clostridiales bacterium 42_27]